MTKHETTTLMGRLKSRKDAKYYDCQIMPNGSIRRTWKSYKTPLTGNISLIAEEDKIFAKINSLRGK